VALHSCGLQVVPVAGSGMKSQWDSNMGQILVKPLSRGGICVIIKTPIESWHKGASYTCVKLQIVLKPLQPFV